MKSGMLKVVVVVVACALAKTSIAAPNSADKNPVVWRGNKYCWYDTGWNGAGWYRCGFEKNTGHGWGGLEGWQASIRGPYRSSGAWFERPPPTPPVGSPSIASERYVEPLRGGPAAGSPTGGSLRGH